MKKLKVIAAMSGGVDSAVAAARAVEAGHEHAEHREQQYQEIGRRRFGGGCRFRIFAVAQGFDDYWTKPLDLNLILKHLRAFFSGHHEPPVSTK